jgi:DNA-binding transcriptional ArsR family regulator
VPDAPDLAGVARLIGEPARAAMLDALLGGPRPAGELAAAATVGRAAASEHLARLRDGGLVVVERDGRRRVFSLASPRVAAALESLSALAAPPSPGRSLRAAVRADALRAGRTCYDHLAGRLGVALADGLHARGWLAEDDGGWIVTADGEAGLRDWLGIDVGALRAGRRPLVRRCLDWTERRDHVAGAVGAALAAGFAERGLTVRGAGRSVRLTRRGETALAAFADG